MWYNSVVDRDSTERRPMNTDLLKYYMARARISPSEMAQKLGISRQAFYQKLRGAIPFKHDDLCVIIAVLGLSTTEIRDVFFANVVDRESTREDI